MVKYLLSLYCIIFFGNTVLGANYGAYRTLAEPVIDGSAMELCWQSANWASIDQVWLGRAPTPDNCSARFKACWKNDKIYILMEVVDNILINWNPTQPLKNYPDNDCPEVFIDEDASGGEHTNNYNAFAYHISTLYDVVDVGIDGQPLLYNDHIKVARTNIGNTYTWEMAMTVYTDKFIYGEKNNPVAALVAGKVMGFSIAYNDSDSKYETRDAMIGSSEILPWTCYNLGYTDSGLNCSWQTASVYGSMTLKGDQISNVENLTNTPSINIVVSDSGVMLTGECNSFAQLNIYNSIGALIETMNIPLNQFVKSKNILKGHFYTLVANTNGQSICMKYFFR